MTGSVGWLGCTDGGTANGLGIVDQRSMSIRLPAPWLMTACSSLSSLTAVARRWPPHRARNGHARHGLAPWLLDLHGLLEEHSKRPWRNPIAIICSIPGALVALGPTSDRRQLDAHNARVGVQVHDISDA